MGKITIISHVESYNGFLLYQELTFAKANNSEYLYGTSQLKATESSDYSCIIHAYRAHVYLQDNVLNKIIVGHAALAKEILI